MLASSHYDNIGSKSPDVPRTNRTGSDIPQGFDNSTPGDPGSTNPYGYENLCRKYFKTPNPTPHYTRKELEKPLLNYTPANEVSLLRKIWKIMHRFLDDSDDQIQQALVNHRQEAIMTTLRKTILRADRDVDQSQAMLNNKLNKKSKKTGTISWSKFGTLTSSLAARIKNKTEEYEADDALNYLTTSLDQIQYIIGCAILKPDIRDEIYCLTLQLLTRVPTRAKASRGWLLLTSLTSCIKPSDEILLHVTRFAEESKSNLASGVGKQLARTSQNGNRYQPMSNYEYLSLINGRSMELSVTLMDGASYNIPVDSSTTSEELLTSLASLINLTDKFGFSVYVSMSSKVTSLGSDSDKLFDSISSCEQLHYRSHGSYPQSLPARLFIRKELFSPWQGIDPQTSDLVAMKLVYSQIVRGIPLKEYVCATDSDLALLIAQQYIVEYSTDLSRAGLRSFLPSCLPRDKLLDSSGRNPIESWSDRVLEAYSSFRQSHPKLLENSDAVMSGRIMTEVVKAAKIKWVESFTKRYHVKVLDADKLEPVEATLKINSCGMWMGFKDRKNVTRLDFHKISDLTCYNSRLKAEYNRSLSADSQPGSDSGCSSNLSNISNSSNTSDSSSSNETKTTDTIFNGNTEKNISNGDVPVPSASTGENVFNLSGSNSEADNKSGESSNVEEDHYSSISDENDFTSNKPREINSQNNNIEDDGASNIQVIESDAENNCKSKINCNMPTVSDEDIVSAKSDTLEMKLWDGNRVVIRTPDAWNIYRIISHIHQGLRTRSVWAVLKSQCFGDVTRNCIDGEKGDLIRLARSSQQEAMISISCVGENLRTGKIGKVPVDGLLVLPVTCQPDDSLMMKIKKFVADLQ